MLKNRNKNMPKYRMTAMVCIVAMVLSFITSYPVAASPTTDFDTMEQAVQTSKKVETKRTPSIFEDILKSKDSPLQDGEDGNVPNPSDTLPKDEETLDESYHAATQDEPVSGFRYCEEIPLSAELQEYTYELCQELDLEYSLILALMWQESKFNVHAVGYNTNGTQDTGIMQINDINKGWLASDYGIEDLTNPYQNIRAGASILANFTSKYDVHTALMSYQFGEAGMKRQVAKGVTTSPSIEKLYVKRNEFRQLVEN